MWGWIFLASTVLVLGAVAVWTVRAQRKHDSLAVLLSAGAPFLATLPLCPFVVMIVAQSWFSRTGLRVPYLVVASAAALSLTGGPVLIALAIWLRRDESLPFSTLVLQASHGLLWAMLTFLGIGLALDV